MGRLLLDNDVSLKLAQYDLVDEFITWAGGAESTYVLPTLRFRFQLRDRGRATGIVGDEQAVARLEAFVNGVNELTDDPSPELLQTLSRIPQIDEGEATLFAAGSEDGRARIITGDKRSMVALATSTSSRGIAVRLRHRVICLEQLVAGMLASDGDKVVQKIRGQPWDQSLRACFAGGDVSSSSSGLESYYQDLRKETGELLAPFRLLT